MRGERSSGGVADGSGVLVQGVLDPRVRRTRRALQDAVALLVEEDAPVTMSAVAQRAGLSRQVLHNHYDSIERLAAEVLARRLLEGVGHEATFETEAAERALVDAVGRDGLAPFLRFIREDRDAFRALRSIAHGQTTAVLARVFVGLAGRLNGSGSNAADSAAASFIAGGMTTLVDGWLQVEDPPSPEEQAALLDHFARAVFVADGQVDPRGPER